MSSFGFEIYPEIGGRFILDGNTTVLNYLSGGTINVEWFKEGAKKYIDIAARTPEGAQIVLIPRVNGVIRYITGKNNGKTQYYPAGMTNIVSCYRLDANTVRVMCESTFPSLSSLQTHYHLLYYIQNASASGFGISFSGGENFYSISDSTSVFPLIYKATINFTGQFTPPIKNPEKSVSFFSWSDPDLTITPGRELFIPGEGVTGHKLGTFYGYDRNGNAWNRSTSMRVCTFGLGDGRSSYGIDIYNAAKQVVYNSRYGALKNIGVISVSGPEYNYNAFPTGVDPMICPTVIGEQYQQTNSGGGGWQKILATNMLNRQISPGYAEMQYYPPSYGGLSSISKFPIFYINANDYF